LLIFLVSSQNTENCDANKLYIVDVFDIIPFYFDYKITA